MLHRHADPAVAGGYTIGAVSGAFTSAFGLLVIGGLFTPIPFHIRTTFALVSIIVLIVANLGLLDLKLPQRHFQIDREVFDASPPVAAARFAFELGMGWRTYVTAKAPYAIILVLVLSSPPDLSAALITTSALALGYGLGRSRVVAAHAFSSQVAVDHPKFWLKTSDLLALLSAAMICIKHLIR